MRQSIGLDHLNRKEDARMNVLIVGAHGQIGQHIVSLLDKSEHHAKAMIRDESQAPELEKLGAETVVADLEQDFSHALKGCDAVIFTAGSGGHTGPEKTEAVDRQGAMKMVEVAEKQNMDRFILVSSMNADTPDNGPEQMKHYFKAKGDADHKLQSSHLNYTILRPGRLLNEPATGTVTAAEHIDDRSNGIPRADVAQVAVSSLDLENTYHRTFEILSGDVPIDEALKKV